MSGVVFSRLVICRDASRSLGDVEVVTVSVLMPVDGREAVDERADSTGGKVPFKGRGKE